MTIQTRYVDYTDGGTALQASVAWDDTHAGPRPTVLVAHQWDGRSMFTGARARALAELGYAGFAIDMYGKGVLGTSVEENSKLMQPLMTDRKRLAQRINAGLAAARSQPECGPGPYAAIGYCFGGLCVIDLARSGADVRGVVSFHGLLDPPQPGFGTAITAKVLALSGADDPMVPIDKVAAFKQEMTAAGVDWQVHLYGGAKHAFAVPGANNPQLGIQYNAAAERRSWATATAFLREVFAGA